MHHIFNVGRKVGREVLAESSQNIDEKSFLYTV